MNRCAKVHALRSCSGDVHVARVVVSLVVHAVVGLTLGLIAHVVVVVFVVEFSVANFLYLEVYSLQMLTSSLRGLLQNRSLETILICIVVLCFPITILPAFTCVMNVRDQTRQTSVTSFCPFRYRTSKFVHRQKISGLSIRAKYRHTCQT